MGERERRSSFDWAFSLRRKGDWKGRHFILVSTVAVAIILAAIFTLRHFKQKHQQSWAGLWDKSLQWVDAELGFRIDSVDVQIVNASKSVDAKKDWVSIIKKSLAPLKNQWMTSLSLDDLKNQLMSEGWLDRVEIRRNFPGQISVQAYLREPFFVVKTKSGWSLADAKGVLISRNSKLPGLWLSYPRIYGFENRIPQIPDLSEVNRLIIQERAALNDLALMLQSFRKKLKVDPEMVMIRDEAWTTRKQFEVSWSDQDRSVEVVMLMDAWKDRLVSLQYVLSEAKLKRKDNVRILGHVDGKWIVQGG